MPGKKKIPFSDSDITVHKPSNDSVCWFWSASNHSAQVSSYTKTELFNYSEETLRPTILLTQKHPEVNQKTRASELLN